MTESEKLARQIKDHIELVLFTSPELDPNETFPFHLIEGWIVDALEDPVIAKKSTT